MEKKFKRSKNYRIEKLPCGGFSRLLVQVLKVVRKAFRSLPGGGDEGTTWKRKSRKEIQKFEKLSDREFTVFFPWSITANCWLLSWVLIYSCCSPNEYLSIICASFRPRGARGLTIHSAPAVGNKHACSNRNIFVCDTQPFNKNSSKFQIQTSEGEESYRIHFDFLRFNFHITSIFRHLANQPFYLTKNVHSEYYISYSFIFLAGQVSYLLQLKLNSKIPGWGHLWSKPWSRI